MVFFMFLVFAAAIAGLIFWIKMIVECATMEPDEGSERLIWILVIVLAGLVGALIYYFVRRPRRTSELNR